VRVGGVSSAVLGFDVFVDNVSLFLSLVVGTPILQVPTLMFLDGYATNLRRRVNLSTLRVNGMKSHHYHIWIERLLPTMVRGYVPEHVWLALAELCQGVISDRD
jgi:hypothetical protein